MSSNTHPWQSLMAVLAAGLALTVAPTTGSAQIITPDNAQAVTGMTYGEWSAVWWQYVLSPPVSDPNNPLLDPTGAGCAVAQSRSSPVFFLVGTAGTGAVTRDECTVPAGKVRFFPLVNAFDVHVPGDGLDTPELVRQDLLALFGPTTELHASIDGVPVGVDLFAFDACAGGDPDCASAFSLTLPGNNPFVGSPAGIGRKGAPPTPCRDLCSSGGGRVLFDARAAPSGRPYHQLWWPGLLRREPGFSGDHLQPRRKVACVLG
jgi:hypothetical protein